MRAKLTKKLYILTCLIKINLEKPKRITLVFVLTKLLVNLLPENVEYFKLYDNFEMSELATCPALLEKIETII